MIPRLFLLSLSLAVCVGMVCAVGLQRAQLLNLRTEEQLRLTEATVPTNDPSALSASSAEPSPSQLREVLQLRNQVGQLRRRRDELLPVRVEHERLLLQLAARGTNGSALPPNYIRKSQARLVGYNTPEDALQSFLWALQNHDLTNYLHALTPEASRYYESDVQHSSTYAKLFEDSQAFIGFSIIDTHRFGDGTIQLDLELMPGLPPVPVNLKQVESQWRISSFP